jgi:hypothetical protein
MDLQGHLTTLRRELDSIGQQVHQDLFELA